MEQPLLFPMTPEEITQALEAASGKKIELHITNNSTSLLSVRWHPEGTQVRMSKIFLRASAAVLAEIARLITNGSQLPLPLTRLFIRENEQNIPNKTKPCAAFTAVEQARTKGKFFDLYELFASLNAEYFDGSLHAGIAWGKLARRSHIRTLGSYNGNSGKITISPVLDRQNTPRYFLEYVIYHEMLHADIGVELKNGRRVLHPQRLRERERLYKNYEKARRYCGKWGG